MDITMDITAAAAPNSKSFSGNQQIFNEEGTKVPSNAIPKIHPLPEPQLLLNPNFMWHGQHQKLICRIQAAKPHDEQMCPKSESKTWKFGSGKTQEKFC